MWRSSVWRLLKVRQWKFLENHELNFGDMIVVNECVCLTIDETSLRHGKALEWHGLNHAIAELHAISRYVCVVLHSRR